MLDFTTPQEQVLDFQSPVDETNLLPDLAANDAAAMTASLTEEDSLQSFHDVRRDLQISGRSKILDDVRARDLEFRKQALVEAIGETLLDPTLNTSQRQTSLEAATALSREDASRPIWAIFKEEAVWEHDGQDAEYNDVQEARWEELGDIQSAKELIEEIKLGTLPSLDGDEGSWLDVAGDMAESAVPFVYADTLQGLHREMYGEDFGITGYIAIGEISNKLKTTFSSLPNGQEKIDWAQKLVNKLKNTEGLIKDHNGFESFILTQSLLDTSFVAGESFDWDRLIDNTVGLLDLTIIGGLVKSAKYPLRMMGIVNSANPEKARIVAAAAVKSADPESLKVANQTAESLVRDGHFPSTSKEHLRGAPSDVVGGIREIDEDLVGIFKKYVVESPTQARQLREMAKQYGGGKIKVNDTHVNPKTGEINVTVGRTATSGYSTIAGAKKAAKLRGLDEDVVGFYKRNKSGRLVSTTETGKGEFFYKFQRTEQLQPEVPLVDLTDVRTTPLSPSGLRTRNFLDIFSMFKTADAKVLSRAEDLKHGVQAQIQRAGRNFDQLNESSKINVLNHIQQGSREEKTWSYIEAVTGTDTRQAMTDTEYLAYSNLRSISDLAHNTENSRLKGWLENNNYRAITGDDGIDMYGIRVSSNTDDIEGVIDVSTGEAVELTKAMREGVSNGTSELYKLRSKETRGLDRLEYVYVDRRNLNTVKEIPAQPLPYIDGYVHRRYTDDYYIERIDPRVTSNGGGKASKSDQVSVVGSAARQSEADTLLERMKAEHLTPDDIAGGVTLRVRLGRDTVGDLSEGEAAFKFAGMNGLLHKGTRGPLLNSINGIDNNVVPVLESIQSSMNKAAGNLSIRPVVEKLERDFVTEFGGEAGFIQLANDGTHKFPKDIHGFNPPLLPTDRKIHRQMLASWEYINFLGRFEDPVTKNWRAGVTSIANWMDGKGILGTFGAKQAKKISARDPLDVLKGSTFTAFLALNPVRQLVVQLSQHMMLAPLDPKYIATGAIYRDTATLLYGAGIRHGKQWNKQKAKLAQSRGISVKQYTDEIDGWMNSGLPTGVDSHNFLAGMLFNTTDLTGRTGADRALSHVGNVLKAPIKFARKVGFNAGEVGNLGLTYHVARRRLERSGKKFTPEDIADEARALSLGMNRAGELKYQRGYLKLTTQFFSMQHKAALTIMSAVSGGKVGSRFFSKEETRRMAAMQVFLFGAEGLGISLAARKMADMYEDLVGEPMDAETREIVTAGLGTYMINEAFSTIDGLEGTRIDFSSVAPMSGSTMMIESIFDLMGKTNEATVMQVIGASSSFLLRTHDATRAAWDILQFPDPGVGNGEKVLLALDQMSRISSGINNYYKGHIALQEGAFRDKHGNATVRATAAEAYGRILFGFGTYDESEYYRTRMDVAGTERSRKEQAKRTAATINSIYQDNKHLDFTLLATKLQAATLWMNLLETGERELFRENLVDELRKQSDGKIGSDVLFNRIMSGGTYSLIEYKSRIQSTMKDEKKKAAINKILEYATGTPKTALDLTEEEQE